MGKQKQSGRLLVQLDNYASREAFLLCETTGCRSVVAAWVFPEGYPGPVTCSKCVCQEKIR